MVGSFVNPLSSVAGFRNQQLAPVINRQGSPLGARSAGEALDAGTPDLSGLDAIRQRSSRTHEAYLAAIKAQRARQQPKVRTMTGTGSYAYRGTQGAAGNPKGLVGRYSLLPGADQALQGLNAAFAQRFGYGIPINEGGRTYARQQQLYNLYLAGKGNLAARPGTSMHESGRALDLGGAFQNAGSREHQWLQQNAGRFGFKWTGKNFKQFEPWHWEWMG